MEICRLPFLSVVRRSTPACQGHPGLSIAPAQEAALAALAALSLFGLHSRGRRTPVLIFCYVVNTQNLDIMAPLPTAIRVAQTLGLTTSAFVAGVY